MSLPFTLIVCLLASNLPDPAGYRIPVVDTGRGLLFTDGGNQGLYLLEDRTVTVEISGAPGAGGNVVLAADGVLIKECPFDGDQTAVLIEWSGRRTVLFRADHFSGPFRYGEDSFLVAERDLVSEIGSDETLWAIREMDGLLEDKEMREHARCCVERIPTEAAIALLEDGLEAAPEDFKLAIAQSLRARGVEVSQDEYPCQKLVPTK